MALEAKERLKNNSRNPYAEGVKLQSPESPRSGALWGTSDDGLFTPKALHIG